jgi:hypothetical protein
MQHHPAPAPIISLGIIVSIGIRREERELAETCQFV